MDLFFSSRNGSGSYDSDSDSSNNDDSDFEYVTVIPFDPVAHPSDKYSLVPIPSISHLFDSSNSFHNQVYVPSDDSFLMVTAFEKCFPKFKSFYSKLNPICIEIGTGSGIVSTMISSIFVLFKIQHVFISTDINPKALDCAYITSSDSTNVHLERIQCNLFSHLKPTTADIIFFNPPYVTTSGLELEKTLQNETTDIYKSWAGGNFGLEITYKFLEQLQQLSFTHTYLLLSVENIIPKLISDYPMFSWEKIITQKCGRELLSVYLLMMKPKQPIPESSVPLLRK